MNPYAINGPAVVSVSGGRTSAYMLRRVLDAHGGRLPPDTHAVFANTGRERPETLRFVADCAERWGAQITWLERDGASEDGYREVEYETASRDGEPFAELIAERRYLPNAVTRFCTHELKVRVLSAWMRGRGYETWTNIVGLRADEPMRVAKARARNASGEQDWTTVCPLYDDGVRRAHVDAFWREQPFTLALRAWESNCDLCFLKGRTKLERLLRDHPESAAWWIEQEKRIGARFIKDQPGGYAAIAERVSRSPLLRVIADADESESIACHCTERRAARRCTCRKRRGQGHALHCRVALGRAA